MKQLTIIVILTVTLYGTSIAQKLHQSEETGNKPNIPVETFQPYENVGHPNFLSPHASPITINNGYVFVVNTPADTVDILDIKTYTIVNRINVGIDPVSIAVRPDGKEIWVAKFIC